MDIGLGRGIRRFFLLFSRFGSQSIFRVTAERTDHGMVRFVRLFAALALGACASANHPSGPATGGSGGDEPPASSGGSGGNGGAATGGKVGTSMVDAAATVERDSASVEPDLRAADDAPPVKPDASTGAGGATGGEKHVVVLIGATSNPKDATNSMMAILGAMKESDGIIAEKGVDATSTAASLAGKALVIIGPNSEAYMGKVSPTLKDAAIPILISKDHLGPTLATAGSFDDHTANDQHDITIINATHPLAAGLPAGDAHVYAPGNRVIYGIQLGPEAIKIATVKGHPDQFSIFAYEKGAMMVGGSRAPAKRIQFFWHRPPDVTEDGKKLFRAAVRWALQP
jgi:hypothetical protein